MPPSGLVPTPADGDAVDVLGSILAARHSCRGFLPDPVPEATVDRILGMARTTASWCNSQAWHVDLVEGESTARFADHLSDWVTSHEMGSDLPAPESYEGVYRERRRTSGHALYSALGIDRTDHAARAEQMLLNFRFFGAPHVAIVTTDASLGTYGAVDCGGYVSTFLTAATSLGVATCAQAALALYSDGVREYLGLEADRLVVCGIAFGFADPEHPANGFRTKRAPLSETVTRHR